MPPSQPRPRGWRQVIGLVFGLTALLVVLLTAFALPSVNSGPNDVPIAVAGETSDADALRERLAQDRPGEYDVTTTVANTAQARELLLDREAYGVLDLTGAEPTMLLASAASSAVAANLTALADQLGAADGTTIPIEDVRPFPDDDPTGAGLSAGALPLALGGWIAAVVLLMTVRGSRYQAVGAIGVAIAGGLALTALMQYGLGTLDGNYWATAACAALGVSAAAWAILGLRTALGNAGLGLGALILILLGNPLSGLSSAPELLPAGWGTLGQILPPGATGSLIRSTAYFDGAGATQPAIVLASWTAAGAALFVLGSRRAARRSPNEAQNDDATAPPAAQYSGETSTLGRR